MNFSIVHILDPIKIDFILNSTFESDLLVANIVLKEMNTLKIASDLFCIEQLGER